MTNQVKHIIMKEYEKNIFYIMFIWIEGKNYF